MGVHHIAVVLLMQVRIEGSLSMPSISSIYLVVLHVAHILPIVIVPFVVIFPLDI